MFLTPVATKATATAAAGAAVPGADPRAFKALLEQAKASGSDPADAAAAASGDTTGAEIGERFLKLLVAQMNNQDPLNPLDNAQVTSQLAQINTVTGIDKLNVSLQKMLERGESGSATEAAAMVGRQVLVEGNRMALPEDGVARAGFELPGVASVVRLEVLDPAGTVVDTRLRTNLPAGVHTFEWDGKADGRTLSPGNYVLRVSASNGDQKVEATALSALPVQAVIPGAGGTSLQLGTAGSRPLSDVRAIL
jgi:flagellar basal-body rod modification protein FlgD